MKKIITFLLLAVCISAFAEETVQPSKQSAFFLGATGMVGYSDYFTMAIEPILGYEFNDWCAIGTGIGFVVAAEGNESSLSGVAEPFLRFTAWHNELVYIDFKVTAGLGFTNRLYMAQVGIRPSLRFRLSPHCDLAADIGLFGAQYQPKDKRAWKPAIGITATAAGISCVYRF